MKIHKIGCLSIFCLFVVLIVMFMCRDNKKEMFSEKGKIAFVLSGRSYCYDDPLSPKYLIQETNGETYVSLNHPIGTDFIERFNVVKVDHKPFDVETELDVSTNNALREIIKESEYDGGWDGWINTLSMHFHHMNNLNNIPEDKYDIVFCIRSDIQMEKQEYDNIINRLSHSKMKDNTIYTCNAENNGVCDQYAYGNYKSMSKYLSLFSQIPKYTSLFSDMYKQLPKILIPKRFNAEKILAYYLKEEGLNIEVVDVTYNLNKNRKSETCVP
jgi:hypothetical protein